MAIVSENIRYEKYWAPLLAGITVASLALAVFHDRMGISFVNFPHVLYFPAVLAGILYGRRSAPLMVALGLAQALLIYRETDGMVPVAAIDGAILIVLAYIMGMLSDRQGLLNARLRDSDRLLQSSEASYRGIFNAASDAIVICDPATGRLLDANEAWVQLTGHRVDEASALYISKLSAPGESHDAGDFMRHVTAALQGDSRLFQWNIWRKDRKIVWVEVNLKKITLADRDLLVAVIRDIRERRRAEEALRESESQFRVLAESTASAIVILQDERVKYANPATERIVGYTSSEMLAMSPLEAISVIDPASILRLNLIRFRRKGSYDHHRYEIKLQARDGQKKWVDVTTGMITFNGRPAFLATGFDITERKQAEEALRKSEEKFRLLAETSPAAIFIYQGNRFVYANPATESITGYRLDELMEMAPWNVVHPDYRDKVEKLASLRSQEVQPSAHYETKIITRDGQERWIDNSSASIIYMNEPAGLHIALDITERKQAEEKLRASLHEKEVLLKEVHHRVKNNLQVVSSMLSLQSMNASDPAMIHQLQESQDRVRSMALIHEKLYRSGDLARINFEEYVRNLTAYLVRSYSRQGQRIELRLDVSDIPLGIDHAIPCGLIINELVSNALKYAFPADRAGTITVSIRQGGGRYTLFVGDDGVGMPVQVDYRNHTSLGLQLVNTLVSQLEGNITMSTEKGTAFTIQFPAEP